MDISLFPDRRINKLPEEEPFNAVYERNITNIFNRDVRAYNMPISDIKSSTQFKTSKFSSSFDRVNENAYYRVRPQQPVIKSLDSLFTKKYNKYLDFFNYYRKI